MNININMTAILGKAWKITWKYRILWLFGMLASFIEGGGSGGSGSGSSNSRGFDSGNLPDFGNNSQEALTSFLSQNWFIFVIIFLGVFIVSVIFYYLGTVGKAGLIHGAYKADLDVEKLTFGEVWREGSRYFWRLFGMGLLVGLPFLIIVLILVGIFLVALVTMAGGNQETGSRMAGVVLAALGVLIPALCCVALAGIFVRMIVEQAKNAMVIKDLGVIESLRQGWAVFRSNFLTIVVMSIILGVLSTIAGTITALPLILAVIPAVMSTILLQTESANIAAALAPLALAGVCFVVYLPILFFLRGIVLTYTQSALTLTYLRLTAPPPVPEPIVEVSNAQ